MENIWQVIATTALGALVTLLVGMLVNFVTNKSKKAIERKKQQRQIELRETIDRGLKPILEKIECISENNILLKKAVQANIRVELRDRYNEYIKKGYAPLSIREDLEALYTAYHNLGRNGVMDNLREKFMQLPVDIPNKRVKDIQKRSLKE